MILALYQGRASQRPRIFNRKKENEILISEVQQVFCGVHLLLSPLIFCWLHLFHLLYHIADSYKFSLTK